MRDHKFVVGSFNLTLEHDTALSLFAIAKLTPAAGSAANMRGAAINMLRHRTTAGLYEAKQIVDFLAENGRLQDNGEFYVEVPRQAVQYTAA